MRVLYLDTNDNMRISEIDDAFFKYDEEGEYQGFVLCRNGTVIAACTDTDFREYFDNFYKIMEEGLKTGILDFRYDDNDDPWYFENTLVFDDDEEDNNE